jgi:hypothetical protein
MDDSAELEIAQLEQQLNTPDPVIEKMRQADPEEAYKLEIDRMKTLNARLIARQRSEALRLYKGELASEFPYAPEEFITGQTRQEMKRSAERLHKANEALLAKLVEKAKETTPPATETTATPSTARGAATSDERARQWGAPPAQSSETVTEVAAVPWAEVKQRAREANAGNNNKREILAEIRRNGPQQLESPQEQFSMRARRRLTGQEQVR